MDDAKLAFETLIVGLFGLIWILVLVDLLKPSQKLFSQILDLFRGPGGPSPLIGLLILPIAYIVGSAEFPMADRLFESEAWPGIHSDDELKVEIYLKKRDWVVASSFPASLEQQEQDFRIDVAALNSVRGDSLDRREQQLRNDKSLRRSVQALYDYQKFVVLSDENGFRLLKPLYDQVVILRGAAFNGFLLIVVCLVGVIWAWREKARLVMRNRYYMLLVIAVIVSAISTYGWIQAEREYDKHVVGIYYALNPLGSDRAGQAPERRVATTGGSPARTTVSTP